MIKEKILKDKRRFIRKKESLVSIFFLFIMNYNSKCIFISMSLDD